MRGMPRSHRAARTPAAVAERSATDGDERLGPVDAQPGEGASRLLDRGHRLGRLTGRELDDLDGRARGRASRATSSAPADAQAPGSDATIARVASRRARASARPSAAMPSPMTNRPIRVSASRSLVGPDGCDRRR